MKKLISIVILSVLLLGGIAGIGTAATHTWECTEVTAGAGDWTCSKASYSGCGSGQGDCVAISGVTPSAGSPNVLRESCTIKNAMSWTEGEIGSTPCSTASPCTIERNDVIGPTGGAGVTDATDQWGMICLINSVNTITNWIFYLLMIIVVVMVVIGGATYMLSAGNPESAGKGKSIIIYGIIGLVIALLARLIPSLVKVIVGMG